MLMSIALTMLRLSTLSLLVLCLPTTHSFMIPLTTTRSRSSIQPRNMATWSDSRAVREYQDFLASGKQEIEKLPDGPSLIVCSNMPEYARLPQAIAKMGMGDDVLIASGQEAPHEIAGRGPSYPIYITLAPIELLDFLKNLPETFKDRIDDFVFCSGGLEYGNIEQVLKDAGGYARDTMTQFLISGIAIKDGVDGIFVEDLSTTLGMSENGEEKFAGECSACGKWSGAVESRLEQNAIRCKTVFYREWRRLMWERSAYDAVFNLVGAVRTEPTTLLDVANYYGDEVSDMVWGISGQLRGAKAITMTYGFEERMFGIAEATGSGVPCAIVAENMFPYIFEDFCMATMVNKYICYAQDERGLFQNVDFMRRAGDVKPIIREGNMRADGVL